MKTSFLACIFLFSFLILSTEISACSTWEWDVPVPTEYSRADSVFIGTVKKIKKYRDDGEIYRATYFDVEKVYKGSNEKKLLTVDFGGMCQPEFKVGEKFVVFARRLENESYLWIGMFEGTENVKKIEKEYLDYLDKVDKGVNETGFLGKIVEYGSVKEGTQNLRIKLSGDNFEQTTFTDENGRFKFTSIPTGKYIVSVQIPNAKVAITYSPDIVVKSIDKTDKILSAQYEVNYESGKSPYLMILTSKEDISIP